MPDRLPRVLGALSTCGHGPRTERPPSREGGSEDRVAEGGCKRLELRTDIKQRSLGLPLPLPGAGDVRAREEPACGRERDERRGGPPGARKPGHGGGLRRDGRWSFGTSPRAQASGRKQVGQPSRVPPRAQQGESWGRNSGRSGGKSGSCARLRGSGLRSTFRPSRPPHTVSQGFLCPQPAMRLRLPESTPSPGHPPNPLHPELRPLMPLLRCVPAGSTMSSRCSASGVTPCPALPRPVGGVGLSSKPRPTCCPWRRPWGPSQNSHTLGTRFNASHLFRLPASGGGGAGGGGTSRPDPGCHDN